MFPSVCHIFFLLNIFITVNVFVPPACKPGFIRLDISTIKYVTRPKIYIRLFYTANIYFLFKCYFYLLIYLNFVLFQPNFCLSAFNFFPVCIFLAFSLLYLSTSSSFDDF